MDESSTTAAASAETIPDLKDIEVKLGRKTPEGLLRWMREEAPTPRGESKPDPGKETGRKSLDDKIRKLKMEMAHLRSVDVRILHQLLAVHEGIEAVKWLLDERGTLTTTSRCSSLTSSQYSLGEGPDTSSWRGSWSSLQDPNDLRLDNISVGSYLDTLADDMDEYCQSSSESVICSNARSNNNNANTAPLALEANANGAAGANGGLRTGSGLKAEANVTAGVSLKSEVKAGSNENGNGVGNGTAGKMVGAENGVANGKPAVSTSFPKVNSGGPTNQSVPMSFPKSGGDSKEPPVWTKVAAETGKGTPVAKGNAQTTHAVNKVNNNNNNVNGGLEKPAKVQQTGNDKKSPKVKPLKKNGKIDLDTCKVNGKIHLEYDAHWRWVQSQEDVTFL